ncbi:MAG: T9SS type A sorting domain-containing protein [Ignavibacteriales bacterium]|nr:MAG: T9SS type A sorting domain-containing protein [Ignavibacteriales bacterium]
MKKSFFVLSLLLAFSFTLAQSQKNASWNLAPYQISTEDRTYVQDNNPVVLGTKGVTDLRYIFTDFEDQVFPPTGWTLEFTGTAYWTLVTTCSGYGTGVAAAKFNFYSATTGTTQSMVTSVMAPTVTGDQLVFDHAYATYTGGEDDQLQLETSTDGGTTFTTLILLHGGNSGELVTAPGQSGTFTPTAAQWATKTFALPVGTNMVKFKAISAYGNNLYLDNIKIGTAPANDVGMFSLDVAGNILPGTVTPMATVKNFGSAEQTFNVTMTIVPAGYTSTKTVTGLAPNTTQQVSFDNIAAVVGTYTVKAYTQLAGDVNALNDTLQKVVSVTDATWMTAANINVGTYMGAGATYKNGATELLFSAGGNSTNKTEANKYDFATNTWVAIAPLPQPRVVTTSAATMGYYFVIGGSDGASTPAYQNTTLKYDITANTWSTAATLPGNVGWSDAYPYQDSLIYLVGGYDGTNYLTSVLLYNVNTDTWRPATSLPTGIFGGAMAIYNNTIVYVGGATASGIVGTTYVGTIDANDRTIITWTSGAAFPLGARFRWDAAKWQDGIIVAGGSPTTSWTGSTDCYVYKVATDTWVPQISKPTAVLGSSVGSIQTEVNQWKLAVATGYNGTAISMLTEVFVDNSYIVPVELVSFNANRSNENVVLSWLTATELNNSGFEIERRSETEDYTTVGFVKGFGTTSQAQSYSFIDVNVGTGSYTYRLKQIDFDGTFSYSNEVKIDMGIPAEFELSQNYPNPFNPSTKINFNLPVESRVSFKVFDILGQEVLSILNQNFVAGPHSITFDGSSLNSGVYFYRIDAAGVNGSEFSSVKKMILTK